METETKNTIPLWLAVAITVVVSLPFGIWLGKLNLPLWAAFIVWAEYFALGAKPSALKIMVPAYTLGVIGGALICLLYQAHRQDLEHAVERRRRLRPAEADV